MQDAARRVSVVVPTCRRPALLDRCLRALVAQDFDPSAYEVIVVDDAASEKTRRVVAAWASRAEAYAYLPGQEIRLAQPADQYTVEALSPTVQVGGAWVRVPGLPRLRYLPVLQNHGPAAARNLGWRSAEGEIIAFTDDDCIPAPDWLKRGVQAFEDGVTGVSGQVRVPLPLRPTDYEKDVAGLARSVFVTANCFYRRIALETAGGFDEAFRLPWREDSDLYFRLLRSGCRLVKAPEAAVLHPVRPARWGVSLSQQRKCMYNALLYRKHPRLYRQVIQPAPPWHYYASVASLAVFLLAAISHHPAAGLLGSGAWLGLTLAFCARRLHNTSRRFSHIAEILVTSVFIPPLAVFWRLRGAIKFRVFFF